MNIKDFDYTSLSNEDLFILRNNVGREIIKRYDKGLEEQKSILLTKEEIDMIKNGNRINAITSFRQRNQCSLEVAKDTIDTNKKMLDKFESRNRNYHPTKDEDEETTRKLGA